MYYHGDHPEGGQHSFVSFSKNGLDFNSNSDKLGMFYFRVFKYKNIYFSIAKNGNDGIIYYKSKDGINNFEEIGNSKVPNVRHSAVHLDDNYLYHFYSEVGTAP